MASFDTHQRLGLLERFLKRALPGGAPRVLDVGGYPGLLAEALACAGPRVVTLDQRRGPLADYAIGSGCALPFGDASFDAVVASDVLEHVPSAERPAFLSEMARVASGWILLGGPFRSPETVAAEAAVDALTRIVRGVPNEWLVEHARCGLPDLEAARRALADLGYASAVVPNGNLHSWLLMMELELLLYALPDALDLAESLDAHYAERWSETDHARPTYRHLLVAHRRPGELEALCAALPPGAPLDVFAPDQAVEFGSREDLDRIERAARRFERLAREISEPPGPERLERAYAERLEAIVEAQERQRIAHAAENETLRARLARYESSRIVRLWKRLRGF